MPLEKNIIKAQSATTKTFEYKPRDISVAVSHQAKAFVTEQSFTSTDFKISELVAQQAGISVLEDAAHQDKINNLVLERLKEVQERAYAEGHELGLIEGSEKAFQENRNILQERLQSIESILKRVEELKAQILIDNEAALIQLVFLVAKKMALRDLKDNREGILEILRHVLGEIQSNERFTVHLANEDLYFIETFKEKNQQNLESLQRVKFVADDNITPGGARIETEYGTVDATVEERVTRAWDTLLSRVPQSGDKKE